MYSIFLKFVFHWLLNVYVFKIEVIKKMEIKKTIVQNRNFSKTDFEQNLLRPSCTSTTEVKPRD